MTRPLRERILEQIADHHVISLATSGSKGIWASSVFYAHHDLRFYFLSPPDSRHGQNIGAAAPIAATINRDYDDWPGIRGLQLEGHARLLSAAAEAEARRIYAQRFPVAGLAGKAPAAIVKALAKVRWYRVAPQRLLYIDNSLGFGQRQELDLSLPAPAL